ncbi:MAG: tRNA preQ1(34) S-adenosylmethionine ribosyltransferase-isomerase QueA [Planctomycetota bacterium]
MNRVTQELSTELLDFPFDERCVATEPAHPRDAARLMVINRNAGTVEHAYVRDLPRWIGAGDALVVNQTAVLRARLCMDGTEGLLLEPCSDGTWRMLIRRAKRYGAGAVLPLVTPHGTDSGDSIELVARDAEAWRVRIVAGQAGCGVDDVIERSGWTPLPPYILKSRTTRGEQGDDDADRAEYETVYADVTARGSVAAPTAGLHFTGALLAQLRANGVRQESVTLHVGAGTFKPIDSAKLSEHPMHAERMMVPAATMTLLAERPRPRIVAVGTTSVRALESLPADAPANGWSGSTSILIAPGHQFRNVDAMLTNFHLPRSTLLALVGAFVGLERLKELYATAQHDGYRFYSFGDAMLIV